MRDEIIFVFQEIVSREIQNILNGGLRDAIFPQLNFVQRKQFMGGAVLLNQFSYADVPYSRDGIKNQ